MKKYALSIVTVLVSCLVGLQSQALSIDWSGTYRFEFTQVQSTSLGDPKMAKGYILNHLHLSPKIIAADGVNVVARFEVLPNENYPESQMGQQFGKSPSRAGTPNASSGDDSGTMANRQGSSTLQVSQLYLNINQEYGAFVAGRAPKQFGLGMTHNAGLGDFDHWYDTHDMVGYKFVIGNLSFMPILAKVYDQSAGAGMEVSDLIWDVEYNNPETDSQFGLYHQTRTSSDASNDAPIAQFGVDGVGGQTRTGGWKTQNVNVLLGRGWESFRFKVEAGFQSGNTGISQTGEEVKLNGYGIATEMAFGSTSASKLWSLRAGIASGDDPATRDYEGFQFDRNYDVAFLMFNHPIGKYDLFRTGLQRTPSRCGTSPCAPLPSDEAMDEEAISNTIYVSPKLAYVFNDRWTWNNSVTWAQLQANPLIGTTVDKNVGFEWDTAVVFKPSERVQWVNELGFLFPGAAFQGGASNFQKSFTYGFNSKAAISF